MPRERPVLLIIGCGDVGLRVLPWVVGRWQVRVLTSPAARAEPLRQAGATPLVGNLDQPHSLSRLGALADAVLHLAPPPAVGEREEVLLGTAGGDRRPGRGIRSPPL